MWTTLKKARVFFRREDPVVSEPVWSRPIWWCEVRYVPNDPYASYFSGWRLQCSCEKHLSESE